MTSIATPIVERLGDLGLEIGPGGIVVFSDIKRAEGYVHHSSVPVALTGYALISVPFARGRFPKTTLAELVTKRPAMDEGEAVALATLCGVEVAPPFWSRPEPFTRHLESIIAARALESFFYTDARPAQGITVRPRGIDRSGSETIPDDLKDWRKRFRALPLPTQMLVASIVWLYIGEPNQWLKGIPHGWHAADAIDQLRAHGLLAEWARMIAQYPAW